MVYNEFLAWLLDGFYLPELEKDGKLKYQHICFLDNFYRCNVNGFAHYADNTYILSSIFGYPAKRIGINSTILFPKEAGGFIDVAEHMQSLCIACGIDGWAAATIADLSSVADLYPFNEINHNTLVIGWGLTPAVLTLLDTKNIHYIDFEISPVRFLRHLKWMARTNSKNIQEKLKLIEFDEREAFATADIMRILQAKKERAKRVEDISLGLFAGQLQNDLSIVQNGQRRVPLNYLEEIKRIAKTVDKLLIKRHPYAYLPEDNQWVDTFLSEIPNAEVSYENTYDLLSSAQVKFVSALSSSLLTEAKYFEKKAYQLILNDNWSPKHLPHNCSGWITVSGAISSQQFIESILCEIEFLTDRLNFSEYDDLLNQVINGRWGLKINKNEPAPETPVPETPVPEGPIAKAAGIKAEDSWLKKIRKLTRPMRRKLVKALKAKLIENHKKREL